MPKLIDYPRASLKNCLELARDVDSLGGSANVDTVAEKSGRKLSGAFSALLASTAKYGLISTAKGRAATTDLFREYKLAYTPLDERRVLKTALLRVPVFARIAEQFRGKALPTEIFEKVLIREFSVSEADASRVTGYFMEGAQMAGLLDGNIVVDGELTEITEIDNSPAQEDSANESTSSPQTVAPPINSATVATFSASNNFVVRITGPGMDSQIQVNETDDLAIVQIMLKKIAKQLTAAAISKENLKPSDGEPSDG